MDPHLATTTAESAAPDAKGPQIFTGSAIARHVCPACHQDFPETMMVCISGRWLCKLCKERALDDGKPARREYSMRTWMPDVEKWQVILTVAVVFGGLGLRMFLWDRTNGKIADDDKPEPWVTKDQADWPLLVSGAKAEFKDKALVASRNAFFVQKPNGEVVSVTVAANAWANGDDAMEKDAGAAKFAAQVSQWTATGAKGEPFALGRILPTTNKAFLEGVVIGQVPESGKTPSRPVRLRSATYSPGMKLYVVVPRAGGQSVHRGTVATDASVDGTAIVTTYRSRYSGYHEVVRGDGSATLLRMDKPIPAAELGGALVMDMRGYAAGVVTAAEPANEKDGTTTEIGIFGGEAFKEALNPGTAPKAARKEKAEKPDKQKEA